MKILITGDRNWTDKQLIKEVLEFIPNITLVINGKARGADTAATLAAQELNISVKEYPANWATFGRAAGTIRNIEMFNNSKPNLVLAFHDNFMESKGTKHMCEYAMKNDCPIILITHSELSQKTWRQDLQGLLKVVNK